VRLCNCHARWVEHADAEATLMLYAFGLNHLENEPPIVHPLSKSLQQLQIAGWQDRGLVQITLQSPAQSYI
jgi:hypothetical protein